MTPNTLQCFTDDIHDRKCYYVALQTTSMYWGGASMSYWKQSKSSYQYYIHNIRAWWQKTGMFVVLSVKTSVDTKQYRIAKCDKNWPPLWLKMPHVSHLCAIQKAGSCLTKKLSITADGNGLKMQSFIRPFYYLVFGIYLQDIYLVFNLSFECTKC